MTHIAYTSNRKLRSRSHYLKLAALGVALSGLLAAQPAMAQTYNQANALHTTCSGTYYDNGGTGNYSSSHHSTITFCPTAPGHVMGVVFTSFSIEAGFDQISAFHSSAGNPYPDSTCDMSYDDHCAGWAIAGSGHNNAPHGEWWNSPGTVTGSLADGGCLSFRFNSDGSITGAGWEATLSCVLVPDVCGNGEHEHGEQCDDGNTVDGDGCSATCQLEYCGNGTVDGSEICDDGNNIDGDGCNSACQLERCGNGTLDASEICDDGNNIDGDGCSASCLSDESCGNGVVDAAAGEGCDDGNSIDGDGCSAVCGLEYCGNGVVDHGEVCDDTNVMSGDGCSSDCMSDETCGNGSVDIATGEACDDGNTVDGDGCQSNCALPTCGDGVLDSGEVCDDGNTSDADGCNARCSSDESCGNGVVDTAVGEACDDGANNNDVDGPCSNSCQTLDASEPSGSSSSGCGCTSSTGGGGLGMLLLILALVWIRRRR